MCSRVQRICRLLLLLGLVPLMLTYVACNANNDQGTMSSGASTRIAEDLSSTPSIEEPGDDSTITSGSPARANAGSLGYSSRAGSENNGIRVTGQGVVVVEPDLAVLSLGVEAREATVSAARDSASQSMTRVITMLKGQGVNDDDIRTTRFNIQPITVYLERNKNNYNYSEPKIIGYLVTNQLSIKIRNLDNTGALLDDAVSVGGDLIRVRGISFTVEDPGPYSVKARELAVRDAIGKAEQLASLTDIVLGNLVYITVTGGTPAPLVYDAPFARAEASYAAAPTTPIAGGEIEITASVQAIFDVGW